MHCKVGVPSERANVRNRGRSLRNKQNKCAVRHKILVETKISSLFFVPLGTNEEEKSTNLKFVLFNILGT